MIELDDKLQDIYDKYIKLSVKEIKDELLLLKIKIDDEDAFNKKNSYKLIFNLLSWILKQKTNLNN